MAASLLVGMLVFSAEHALAADRLIGLHSAQVMSQSMPWIAREAGLFKKHDLDFRLVFIPSSPVATAATLNGDAEIGVTGAVGNVRAIVQGFTDLVFVGGIKNFLTHSILGKPDIKRPEDLKGKKSASGDSAATRITSPSRRLNGWAWMPTRKFR
jgi:ABC-type nitrate/sulfonate/bicarbonate transport system substrate-binding protein